MMKLIYFLSFLLLTTTFEVSLTATEASTPFRDYWAGLGKNEAKEIHYITTTLARSSLAKIALARSSLKKAGAKVDHVHPLNFLLAIFAEEETKAAVHALQKRDWVWSEFFAGIQGSFKEEMAKNNVSREMIADFSRRLEVDETVIEAHIEQHDWKGLVNTLITTIPRRTETDRYNW